MNIPILGDKYHMVRGRDPPLESGNNDDTAGTYVLVLVVSHIVFGLSPSKDGRSCATRRFDDLQVIIV